METLNNANTVASLILAIFGIGGYAIGITTYLRGKASKAQQGSNTVSRGSSSQPKFSVRHSNLSWLDWMEVIAAGSKDFVFLGDPDGYEPNGCFAVPMIAALIGCGALLFFALIFWVFGLIDIWRPAWFVAALVFLTIVLATWVYHVGRRVEEKAKVVQRI